jgi:hypothetical protein
MADQYLSDDQQQSMKDMLYGYLQDKAARRAGVTSKGAYEGAEDLFVQQKGLHDIGSLAGALSESASMAGQVGGKRAQSDIIPKMNDNLYKTTQGAFQNFKTMRGLEEDSNMNDVRTAQFISGIEQHEDRNKLANRQLDLREQESQTKQDLLRRQLEARAMQKRRLSPNLQGPAGQPVVMDEEGNPTTLPTGFKYRDRPQGAGGAKPPPGYRYTTGGALEPIPGGPVAERNQLRDQKAQQRQTEVSRAAQTVVEDLGRAMEIIENSYTASGPVMGNTRFIPGTPSYQAKQLLESVKSNIGIDRLQAMRDSSPTGGALGQVPFQQQQRLEQLLGSLDLNQPEEMLLDNIKRVSNLYQDIIHGPGEGPERFQLGFDERGRTRSRPQQRPQSSSSGKIRVRNKQTGQTGMMPESNFNPQKYERID